MGLFSGMFGKKKTNFISPLAGRMVALADAPDPAFAEGMMGQGFAVELSGDQVVAPFDGEVVSAFPTGHAYGLKSDDGVEALLHIGMDTVQLGGKGFDCKVATGQRVKGGEVLATLDLAVLRDSGKSLVSPVVFTGGQEIKALKIGRNIALREADILEYES